jgi:alcohol dehydrogenase (cytochrome c)
LFYVVARRVYSIFYYTATGKPEGWAGRDHNLGEESTLRAINYRTGEIRWNHELGPGESTAGILTTAGNLLFTGDAQGNLLALDAATGKTLWHVNAGGSMVSSPMTYALDGRQYVVEGVQGVLYAWTLPE